MSLLSALILVVAPCWAPPVDSAVADPFREPACAWCPGNRGIEYATEPGDAVRAVASGEVTFAGWVAGTGYLVVRHADGLLATYGNLADMVAGKSDIVVAGAVVGHAAGAFHFGVRRDGVYIDPAPMLGEEFGVVRLIPADGSAALPSPRRTRRCPVSPAPIPG